MMMKRVLRCLTAVCLAAAVWLSCIRLSHSNRPPAAPLVAAMADSGSYLSPCTLEVRGTDPDGDRLSYQTCLRISADSSVLSHWSLYHPSGEPVTMPVVAREGVVPTSVRSRDEMGDSSEFSSDVTLWFANFPPYAPTVDSAEGTGWVGLPVRFWVRAVDPEGRDVSVRAVPNCGAPPSPWFEPRPSGSTIEVSYPFPASGRFLVQFQALDDSGNASGLSEAVPVTVLMNARLFGRVDIPGGAKAVVAADSLAYVGAGENGLHVVDFSDSSAPSILGRGGSCSPTSVAYERSLATVSALEPGTFDGILYAFDVRYPRSPMLLGSLSMDGANRMAADSTCALVGADFFGGELVNIVDLGNPRAMRVVAQLAVGEPSGLAVRLPYGYVAVDDKLLVVDLSNRSAPYVASSLELGNPNAVCIGPPGYIYVAAGATLYVVSVADPVQPTVVGSATIEGCVSMHHASGHLALANASHGVRVYSLQDPARPTLAGFLGTSDATGVWCYDRGFLVADGTGGLLVVGYPTGGKRWRQAMH